MVTNAMLQEAAAEAENALLKSLENKKYEPHQFSGRFEKKMKKLINRVKHPIRYNILRSAAAIILIVFILFGSLVTFSPEVRADVVNWVKSTFEDFFQYASNGRNEPAEYEYYLESMPEDYRELNIIDRKDGKTYLYVNSSGDILQFTYAYGARADSVFVKTENYTQLTGLVNGISADIYLTTQESETNVIIWCDPDTDALLCIDTKADQDTLIALAEVVSKREKQKNFVIICPIPPPFIVTIVSTIERG